MAKSRKSRRAAPQEVSGVDPAMLAQYRRAARAPTMLEGIRTLRVAIDDYHGLLATGDLTRALGAGLAIVDIGLRIAAASSLTAAEREFKADLFGQRFGSMMGSLDHAHVARIADAAVAAETWTPAT